jgi:hypothetical protein
MMKPRSQWFGAAALTLLAGASACVGQPRAPTGAAGSPRVAVPTKAPLAGARSQTIGPARLLVGQPGTPWKAAVLTPEVGRRMVLRNALFTEADGQRLVLRSTLFTPEDGQRFVMRSASATRAPGPAKR